MLNFPRSRLHGQHRRRWTAVPATVVRGEQHRWLIICGAYGNFFSQAVMFPIRHIPLAIASCVLILFFALVCWAQLGLECLSRVWSCLVLSWRVNAYVSSVAAVFGVTMWWSCSSHLLNLSYVSMYALRPDVFFLWDGSLSGVLVEFLFLARVVLSM